MPQENDDAGHPYAHFSPQIMCVSYNVPIGKQFTDEKGTSWRIMEPKTDGEALAAASWSGSVIHEHRHFYDWIGTPLGAVLFDHLQRIVNEYLIRFVPASNLTEDTIVPLVEHAKQHPNDMRVAEFLTAYRWNMTWYTWLMGDFPVSKNIAKAGLVTAVQTTALGKSTPFIDPRELNRGGFIFRFPETPLPLGGLQILECLAYVVEQFWLNNGLYGSSAEQREQFMANSSVGWKYLLPKALMEHYLGEVPIDLLISTCEFALCLPGRRSNDREFHPGWRFISILNEIKKLGIFSADGFAQAVERLCQNENWVRPADALRDAARYAERQVEHNQNNPAGSIVKVYNLIFYKLALLMHTRRIKSGFPHRGIEHYFESIDSDDVPRPVLVRAPREQGYAAIPQYGDAIAGILLRWLVLEDLIHQITRSISSTTCCLKHEENAGLCPWANAVCGIGNQYVDMGNGDRCSYGEALNTLGLSQ